MRWMLFLHILSVAFWLGGTATLYVLYRKVKHQGSSEGLNVAHDTARSVVKGILNPSAILVLFTGIGMLMQMGLVGSSKPFWLSFMEQFGGIVALLSIILLTWQIRHLDKASSSEERARRWRVLNQTMVGIGAGVALTIFVVALRL